MATRTERGRWGHSACAPRSSALGSCPWCCAGRQRCSEETVGMSATAFINAFTELDVPRSSGAVSGGFRTGCAARVLVGSVLVTCGALPSFAFSFFAGSGAPSGIWAFRGGFRSRKAPPPAVGVSLWVTRRSRACCGKETSTAFLVDAKFDTWLRTHPAHAVRGATCACHAATRRRRRKAEEGSGAAASNKTPHCDGALLYTKPPPPCQWHCSGGRA